MQLKKKFMPPFTTYYGAATAVASIKECRVTVEMLASVGYTPDKNTTPDHTMSTLTGGICMKLTLATRCE